MERVLPLVIVLVLAASAASASNDDVLGLLRTLIEVDSTSGSERAVADVIAARLELGNWTVVRQAVEGGDGTRQNLLALRAGATAADVRVLFSTHMDTVPPYIAFREDATTVFGRGASDAKGPLAAMVTALDALLVSGHLGPAQERALGLLFVVGEEVDHSGMIRANDLGLAGLRYLVNGEPTESTMARGHKGGYKFDLETHGRAAHSGYPELGDSAIIPLIETALDLSRVALPVHPDLGPTTLNVGLIHGGVAANVVPDFATAEVMVRVATSVAETERLVQAVVGDRAQIYYVASNEPVICATLPGYPLSVMAYNTDIPFLQGSHETFLMGPGSILVAHGPDEAINKQELIDHVALYERLARDIFALL